MASDNFLQIIAEAFIQCDSRIALSGFLQDIGNRSAATVEVSGLQQQAGDLPVR
jgi:hypothetical protein